MGKPIRDGQARQSNGAKPPPAFIQVQQSAHSAPAHSMPTLFTPGNAPHLHNSGQASSMPNILPSSPVATLPRSPASGRGAPAMHSSMNFQRQLSPTREPSGGTLKRQTHSAKPSMQATITSAKGQVNVNDNVKVVVRVRPMSGAEQVRGDASAVQVNPEDPKEVQLLLPNPLKGGPMLAKPFSFHYCLGPEARQQDIMNMCGIAQLLDAALAGYNVTIFAYGQTGSGKTHTMSGREEVIEGQDYLGDTDDGIMSRSVKYLFEQLRSSTTHHHHALRASYYEIYNEALYDLLKWSDRQLAVRYDTQRSFYVPDLFVRECLTEEDTMGMISKGVRNRRTGSHELNLESSRSHSIMTLYCDSSPVSPADPDFGTWRYGKVNFVDLAGSERLRDTRSTGDTLRETTNINRSLFALGKVISALAEGQAGAHIPYRDSKLTKLLMDSLGGSALSLMIACCSPSAAYCEETLSTLSYATRTKNIQNRPTVQVDPNEAALHALRREINLLRAENSYLRDQVTPGMSVDGFSSPLGSSATSPMASARTSGDGADQPPAAGERIIGPGGGTPALRHSKSSGSLAAQAARGAAAEAAGGRPAADLEAGASPAAAPEGSAAGGGTLDLVQEAQKMLAKFSHENERLSEENERLRSGRNLVANDYKAALDEVDWLRTRLATLESTLLASTADSALLNKLLVERGRHDKEEEVSLLPDEPLAGVPPQAPQARPQQQPSAAADSASPADVASEGAAANFAVQQDVVEHIVLADGNAAAAAEVEAAPGSDAPDELKEEEQAPLSEGAAVVAPSMEQQAVSAEAQTQEDCVGTNKQAAEVAPAAPEIIFIDVDAHGPPALVQTTEPRGNMKPDDVEVATQAWG